MVFFTRGWFVFAAICFLAAAAHCQEPEKVTACQLKNNPSAYNHKLVQVTAFISHGFEDFSLFDPACLPWMGIWLEYGGTAKSGTMYCCGVTNSRTRPVPLQIENISLSLVTDEHFRQFDRLFTLRPDGVIHATLVGRFFAGKPRRMANGEMWDAGYGHMGCCSLLAIQQVISVDPQDRGDLDYQAFPEQPDIRKAGCGYRHLTPVDPFSRMIQDQRGAETELQSWVFDHPRRVASDWLARLTKLEEASIALKEARSAPGHVVYQWKNYMIVVSRPYLLTFYARDPKQIAWVVVAGYESGCGKDQSVTRIK
ncbi:MAG TPA: hypothetical protein VKE93_21810 [Candidatus Angelobacter sp.]|nr:hypothetical protein [Candidatus Angelobacter sp.]